MIPDDEQSPYQELADLYASHRPLLRGYPWEWERDRWDEFLFALFHHGLRLSPALSRNAVRILRELNIDTATALGSASQSQKDFLQQVLTCIGLSGETSANAVNLLVSFSKTVIDKWNGHVQVFLRDYGLKMATELQVALMGCGLGEPEARGAAILWLQNVANLPLLDENNPDFQSFCAPFKLSTKQMLEHIDNAGLYAGLVEDLVAIKSALTKSTGEPAQPET